MDNRKLIDKSIRITESESGNITEIMPRAVENCMKPGTFLITPIEVSEEGDMIEYRVGDAAHSFSKEAIKTGDIIVEELPFVPQTVQSKPSCNPCRNCGRC